MVKKAVRREAARPKRRQVKSMPVKLASKQYSVPAKEPKEPEPQLVKAAAVEPPPPAPPPEHPHVAKYATAVEANKKLGEDLNRLKSENVVLNKLKDTLEDIAVRHAELGDQIKLALDKTR